MILLLAAWASADTGDTGASACYTDADGDGYGATVSDDTGAECPDGTSDIPGDCDDGDAWVYPDAPEWCNDVDDDCDNEVDEGWHVWEWYRDADGDGYGVEDDTEEGCERPGGYVAAGGDCDDRNGMIHPGAEETWYDGVDEDCGDDDDDDRDGDGSPVGEDCDDTDADVQQTCAETADGCGYAANGASAALTLLVVGWAGRRRTRR